jgi:hypothetical protein
MQPAGDGSWPWREGATKAKHILADTSASASNTASGGVVAGSMQRVGDRSDAGIKCREASR